jgi:polyvinyl alcohol dehydrogenase (cytochrome)
VWTVLAVVVAATGLPSAWGAPAEAGRAHSEPPTERSVEPRPRARDWTVYGHDLLNTRLNKREKQVNRRTAAQLTERWSKNGLVGVTGTPIVSRGVAYFGDWTGTVWAVDAATGAEIWTAETGAFVVGSPAVDRHAVYVSSGRTLFRLERATGAISWQVETNESSFAQINASPVLVDGLVIQGVASYEVVIPKSEYTFRGSIGAYDADTGREVWRFYTTPNDATAGAGVGVWSTPAVDRERRLLYVGSGNTYAEPTAPLADSILAIEYRTGVLRWSRQFTNPDVFSAGNPTGKDADVGASPNLWRSRGRDLVGAGDKTGVYHALDRDTGAVVWETTLTPGSFFGGEIGSAALVDGKLVAVSNVGDPGTNAPTNRAKVFALDPKSGEILWESEEFAGLIFAPVSAVRGLAFVAVNSGLLTALDTRTGEALWSYQAPAMAGGAPSIVDGRVLWGYGFSLFGAPGDGGVISFEVSRSSSAGCPGEPAPAGVSDRTVTSGGLERQFQLALPEGYDGRRPLPVVLGLHALSIDHRSVQSIAPGLAGMAEDHDFIGVAPSGRLDGSTPYWSAADSKDNHDVAFIGDLLDLLERELCVDTARVYATGMSNGAQMSSLLACRLPDRITAVAPVAGVEFSDTCRERPVPVMAFHGTADPIVTYDGGGLNAATIANTHLWKGDMPDGVPEHQGVDAAMRAWAAHNGCDPKPVEERVSPEVRRRTWRNCEAETILYVVDGGGHAWPGLPVPQFEPVFGHATTDIDASVLISEFFFGHPA